jgi:outer membrane lipoprotein carrier protein
LIIFNGAFAQSGDQAIKTLQASFQSISTFEAMFNQKMINSNGDVIMTLDGKIYFSQPEKFNIDLGSKGIISNGNDVFNYDEELGRVVISSAADRTNSFSLKKFVFDFPAICNATSIKSGEIELTPINDIGFKRVLIRTIDSDFISEIEIIDNASNKIIFRLSDYKLNVELDSQVFEFDSQKGLEVIDLR